MRTTGSIEVDRKIEDVFEYTTNNVAEWSITVVEDEPLEATHDVVGSTFRCVTNNHNQVMEFQGVVTRHDPPTFHACRLAGASFDIEVEYAFERLDGTTRVTQTSVARPKGIMTRMFFFCMGWLMKKGSCDALEKELQSLKQHAERA